MHIFCNLCMVPINKTTNGFITSCSHIFCEGCMQSAAKNTCPECKTSCSAIGINKTMPRKVMLVLMTKPSASLCETIKIRRFHIMQYRIMFRLTRNRVGRLRRLQAIKHQLKVEKDRDVVRQTRIKMIREMRIQIRVKSSNFFKAMKSGAPVDDVRDLYNSAKRTLERCERFVAAAEAERAKLNPPK